MRSLLLAAALAGPLLAAPVAPAQPAPPALVLPIQCRIGADCEIQNYVDRDPGPGAKDYRCGSRSYQGHNGIDFRLATMRAQRQGIEVLAAADGRVLRLRDGVADASVRATGANAVEGRECGNGVVIGHAGGFETQYCHLAQGSIAVRIGQAVKAGDAIGQVGLSGQTEYPHLHFTVRQGASVVDPFAYGAPQGACEAGRSLWVPELRDVLSYKARSVLNVGFATRGVRMAEVDEEPEHPDDDAPAIVAYARAIGLKEGDVQTLTLKGPDGAVLATNAAKALPRDQAQSMVFAGVPHPVRGWARGTYRAEYVVREGGQEVLRREFELAL
jgi:hypothetical protein